jgi:uncharacterized protein involved in response to NO
MQQSQLVSSGVDARPHSPPILGKGFRPFFLSAAAFAAAILPIWLLILTGRIHATRYLEPSTWHAHEMIFGFVLAVIAGFLLTAVGNWTQRETVVGKPLLMLAGLWLAGRFAVTFATVLPRGLPALLDLAFLPALILVLARPLVAAKNRRNLVMLGILGALLLANIAVHLDALGVLPSGSARRASLASIDMILLMIVLISGRVFPMFTRNATSVQTIRSMPRFDVACVVAMALLTGVGAVAPGSKADGALALVAGLLAAARSRHWGARHTLRQPLLWIIHGGYAWLVVGLLLRGAAGLGAPVSGSLATHALTVGAIGSVTLGMMARVSLGHTGRMLVASAPTVVAFVAINLAAGARVLGPVLAPAHYRASLIAAASLWAVAFVTFLVVYVPILSRPRVDGRPG